MNIDLLLTFLRETDDYRVHLAKTAGGIRPLDVLARCDEEWKSWNNCRNGEKQKNRFPAKFIVTFAQISGDNFLFGGIYKILERYEDTYKIELLDKHTDLIGRLVIESTAPNKRGTAFTPHYILKNTKIVELYKTRYRGEIFTSINNINHKYQQIETIIKNELSDWKSALSKVKGVYLLTDKKMGRHYVGSAYGEGGIWSRWNDYVYSQDGGNKKLKELKKNFTEEYFKENFKFTVLETVGSTATEEDIINLESFWKEKLLTRQFGYNAN